MKTPETLQDYFDIAWDWCVVQKQPPAWDDVKQICLYRGPNGERCFIGAAIPDDKYDPHFEKEPLGVVIEHLEFPWFGALKLLQQCHDLAKPDAFGGFDATYPVEAENNLRRFAISNNLEVLA